MRYRLLVVAAALLATIVMSRPALAIKQFCDGFKAECLKDHPNEEFVKEVTKGTNICLTCHQGKKRKNKNAFGAELAKLLDKKKDSKDKEKISAAIKKVLALHVDPKDDKSETYGDRVKAGKWPVGTLEELKKEPAGANDSKDSGESEESEEKDE
jgi:cytochrome c2